MSTRGGGYRPDVQGLRGIAVLAVVVYHVRELLPGGFMGVDIFFVISGFVITRSLLRERASTGTIGLVDFYRRRVHRLAPVLFVAVTVTTLAGVLLGSWQTGDELPGAAASTFLLSANFFFAETSGYFGEGAGLNPLLHTWSLSLEEQFYLVYPVTLLVLFRLSRGPRSGRAITVRRGLVLALTLSLALSLLLTYLSPFLAFGLGSRRLAFFMMPARGWQFLAGALVALREADHRRRPTGPDLGLIGIGLIAVALVTIDDAISFPGLAALLPTAGTALVIAAGPGGVVNRALTWRPLVHAGDISYSWYLWHWPIIVFAEASGTVGLPVVILAAVCSLPVSQLSYRFIEDRFRHPGRRAWLTAPRLLIGSALVGLLLLVVLPPARRLVVERSEAVQAYDAADIRLGESAGCRDLPLPAGLDGCTADAPAAADGTGGRRVALIGDSNALHFAEGVIAAARPMGASTTVVTEVGCPGLDVELRVSGELDRECERFRPALLTWLAQEDFDVVVLADASSLYLRTDRFSVRRGDLDGSAAYSDALRDLIGDLTARGTGVVVVHPIPKFSLETQEGFGSCSAATLLLRTSACVETMDRNEALRRREPGFDAEIAALAGLEADGRDVVGLDVFDDLCPDERCASRLDGVWTYSDSRHLSAAAARGLADRFADAIRAVDPRRG